MFASADELDRWETALTVMELNRPMYSLVDRFRKTEAAAKVGCGTSHETLSIFREGALETIQHTVSVEYFPTAQRFRLTYLNWFGVPRDVVFCEADEALARLVFAANRMHCD
jgi:hypothetical protein